MVGMRLDRPAQPGRRIEPAVAEKGVAAVRPHPNPAESRRGKLWDFAVCLGESAIVGKRRDECTHRNYAKPQRSAGARAAVSLGKK